MTPDHQEEYQRRQRGRAKVTALLLGAMVVLFFAIAIVRMS